MTIYKFPELHTALGSLGISLKQKAKEIAELCNQQGAIIITFNDDKVAIGTDGLDPHQVQESLCVGIYYNELAKQGYFDE